MSYQVPPALFNNNQNINHNGDSFDEVDHNRQLEIRPIKQEKILFDHEDIVSLDSRDIRLKKEDSLFDDSLELDNSLDQQEINSLKQENILFDHEDIISLDPRDIRLKKETSLSNDENSSSSQLSNQLRSSNHLDLPYEDSNSSDLLFPRNVRNVVDKLREGDESSAVSDQENLDDVDYCPLPIEEESDDEYVEDEHVSDEEEKPKRKKRKKVDKRNPYQNKRKFKKQKICDFDELAQEGAVIEYTELENGFKLPSKVWDKLYPYQQAGIKWLWELHQNSTGGILADEPGLGKTIQIICFLYGLSLTECSNVRENRKTRGPVILVCPATLMHQWVNEIDKWYPNNVVTVLHHTSPYKGSKRKLLDLITKLNGILITSYTTISICQDIVFNYDWHYVILDEGHKIRNPDAQATLAVKRFKTPHRLILSGSPIQNNLKELWSLFDFIYPGKLGTLPVFLEQFAVPITQGGYSNATEIQVQIAYRCATVLRDTISPYLLRRLKEDVKLTLNLPNKNEQVLFCKLTECQKKVYETYLKSKDVAEIVKGSTKMFVGLINLRKISNHPDLFTNGPNATHDADSDDYFGNYKRSGKMKVLNTLLKQWYKQNHKVLLFTQGKQMLNILEKYVKQKEYTYLIMDGSTSVNQRPQLIKQFNEDPDIYIFLLTTKVGGLGVNLTGADRIIIMDPDWNPMVDLQARERSWRIGQDRQVTIYRLLTTGTVEEKIYHRQIFKQYLTNKILKNPKQRRFFKTNDLYELFTLGNDDRRTESSDIFAGTGSEVMPSKKKKKKSKDKEKNKEHEFKLPPEKIEELRERAKKLSQMLANNQLNGNENSSSSSTSNDNNADKSSSTKKEKGAIVEGKRIKYLDRCDQYREQILDEDPDELGKKQDDYVLRKLFKNASLHSALQHDAIESAQSNDFIIVENEAERVANEAIKALQRSRESCLAASTGMPNWTGHNGYSRKLPNSGLKTTTNIVSKPAFGKVKPPQTKTSIDEEESIQPSEFFSSIDRLVSTKPSTSKQSANNSLSSNNNLPKTTSNASSLLNAIRERNKIIDLNKPNNQNNNQERPSFESIDVKQIYQDLLENLRCFIAFKSKVNGEATTAEVLNYFSDKIDKEQTAVFKALLWKICNFVRRDQTGFWVLKPEFR